MPQEIENKIESNDSSNKDNAATASEAFQSELSNTLSSKPDSLTSKQGTISESMQKDERVSDSKIWNPDIMKPRPTDFASMTNFRVREGSHDLSTGDRYVVKNGKEILMTPGGDLVTVNQDGTYKVDGDLKGVEMNKDGNQVLVFKDGAKVTIGPAGIKEVERGNHTVRMNRNEFSLGCILWDDVKPMGQVLEHKPIPHGR